MVNSKKMSKSSIAVIVLSILLVLSMILGLTGAWFTASTDGIDGSANGNFGTVDIAQSEDAYKATWSQTSTGTVEGKLLPGSKLTLSGGTVTAAAGTVKSYVMIKITDLVVKIDGAEDAGFAAYFTLPQFAFDDATSTGSKTATPATYADMYVVEAEQTLVLKGGEATINTLLPTEYEGKALTITYKVVVRAIQFDNISEAKAYEALSDANWNNGDPQVAAN
ncbi:MAG: hypothetical protein ACI4TZ_03560 [Christensenellales bacterium]